MTAAPQRVDCDVCIVGAGPVGSTLALMLARAGHRVLVVERERAVYPLPRAVHVDDEIMRIFQGIGMTQAIAPHIYPGSTYEFRTASGEILLDYTMDPEHRPLGWLTSNMIYQPGVEGELQKAVEKHLLITQWRGRIFAGLTEEADGIIATVREGQEEWAVHCRFLIGCDGARSLVRSAAGIGAEDMAFSEPWLVIDTLISDPTRLHSGGLQICDPSRPTTSIRISPNRHRWEFMLLPGEDATVALTDAFVAKVLEPWDVDGAVTIERRAVYTFEAIIASEWRRGRVMLAGDAAHQMPPFAGQGMCSGLRDAANLAWKLDAVLAGRSPEALLDTYQVEREPNVRAIIGIALMMGQTVCITDPAAAAERDAQMLEAKRQGASADQSGFEYPPIQAGVIRAQDAGAGRKFPQPTDGATLLDDVIGRGPALITRGLADGIDAGDVPVFALASPAMAPYAGVLTAWLDEQAAAEAVLVRPDRYVFGTGAAAGLAVDFRRLVGVGQPAPLTSDAA